MSVSTNAYLAFGIDLGDMENLHQGFINALHGRAEDFDDEVEDDGSEWDFENIILKEAELTNDDEYEIREKAIERYPLTMITHRSGDYQMLFLALNGSEYMARRGYPLKIDLTEAQGKVVQEKIDALRDFFKRHDLEWNEPSWHIFSYWN